MPVERWKPIPEYSHYEVSTWGRVRLARTHALMKISPNGCTVNLTSNHVQRPWQVHTLVGCAFLGLDILDPYRNRVLHIDNDYSNNHVENLYIEDTSDQEGEIWSPICPLNGAVIKFHYRVSNLGRIKSCKHDSIFNSRGKQILRCNPDLIVHPRLEYGYEIVWLGTEDGGSITYPVHRIVAYAFCPNNDPDVNTQVNHIDGDKSNNRASNLEWCTPKENIRHAVRTGLHTGSHSTNRPVKHLETGHVYSSMTAASKALGKHPAYVWERVSHNKPCYDSSNNIWTFEELGEGSVKLKVKPTSPCVIDEFPGTVFDSLAQASRTLGRYEGYIGECIRANKPIRDPKGNLLHIHLLQESDIRKYGESYK